MRLNRWASVVLALSVVLVSCSLLPATAPRVEGAWARPGGPSQAALGQTGSMQKPAMAPAALPGMMNTSAVYFTIVGGSAADSLLRAGVEPSIAETVEIHETKVVNNVAQMQPVTKVEVAPGSRVELKPGGYHVMLINLKRELKVGDRIEVRLTFEKAGEVSVDAEVRAP